MSVRNPKQIKQFVIPVGENDRVHMIVQSNTLYTVLQTMNKHNTPLHFLAGNLQDSIQNYLKC